MSTPYIYKRIVVKAGSALLTHGGERPNLQVMANLVEQIAQLHEAGVEVLLVSSGAVAAGRHVLGVSKDGRTLPVRQALAAIGQTRLMNAYEELFDWRQITIAQVLLTLNDVGIRGNQRQRLRDLNVRNTLLSLLGMKVIPIINENDVVAVDELAGAGFGDNDNLSARVARAADAELLVMLGLVNGLYTADPSVDPAASLIPEIRTFDKEVRAIAGAPRDQKGRGGMATKMDAAKYATDAGIDVVIAGGLEPEIILRLARGERIGTLCPAGAAARSSRKNWLKKNTTRGGNIVVDSGAADVLLQQKRSLLPVGVMRVTGSFDRGETVAIMNSRGIQIAAGITNYSSEELDEIKGLRSDRIEEVLGDHYGDEVVHRNNMILL